jgi:hypothetical protein
MNHTDDFLERILQTELGNLNRISRFFSAMTIDRTANFPGVKRVREDLAEKTFKPDNYSKYIVLTLITGVLLLTGRATFLTGSKEKGLVIALVILILLIFSAIKQLFFDKSLNFVIHLDRKGISIDDRLFEWNDIYATAILSKPSGKSTTRYLIIAFNDLTTYEKFDLSQFMNLNFWSFSSTLSKYIEYFKPA